MEKLTLIIDNERFEYDMEYITQDMITTEISEKVAYITIHRTHKSADICESSTEYTTKDIYKYLIKKSNRKVIFEYTKKNGELKQINTYPIVINKKMIKFSAKIKTK